MTKEATIPIDSLIDKQLAQIMATYGDVPEKLMDELFKLVIEWYCQGIAAGIETERKSVNE